MNPAEKFRKAIGAAVFPSVFSKDCINTFFPYQVENSQNLMLVAQRQLAAVCSERGRPLPMIVCFNHISHRDPIAILALLQGMQKEGLIERFIFPAYDHEFNKKNPLYSDLIEWANAQGIMESIALVQAYLLRSPRSAEEAKILQEKSTASVNAFRRRARGLAGRGDCWVISLEGHRSELEDHGLQPAENGVNILVGSFGAGEGMILPVGITYDYDGFDRGLNLGRKMFLNIGRPLNYSDLIATATWLNEEYDLGRNPRKLIHHAMMWENGQLLPESMRGVYSPDDPDLLRSVLKDEVKLGFLPNGRTGLVKVQPIK